FGNFVRGGKDRGAAQAVTDQNCRRSIHLAQMIGGSDQIVDVRRKMRVSEFAFTAPQSGEIETQYANAMHRQPLGDMPGRENVLAAGEAMREQCEGGGLA